MFFCPSLIRKTSSKACYLHLCCIINSFLLINEWCIFCWVVSRPELWSFRLNWIKLWLRFNVDGCYQSLLKPNGDQDLHSFWTLHFCTDEWWFGICKQCSILTKSDNIWSDTTKWFLMTRLCSIIWVTWHDYIRTGEFLARVLTAVSTVSCSKIRVISSHSKSMTRSYKLQLVQTIQQLNQ